MSVHSVFSLSCHAGGGGHTVDGLAARRSLDWSSHSWAVAKYGIVMSGRFLRAECGPPRMELVAWSIDFRT